MTLPKQNPEALAASGFRGPDLVGERVNRESSHSLEHLQAVRLTRRCAISLAMAAVLAPMIHGEAHNA
jgi:hypothetical protein